MKLGVVIPTIYRSTLDSAVNSAVAAKFDEIIIIDDSGEEHEYEPQSPQIRYFKLGRNFGRLHGKLYYGQIALSVGNYLSTSDFLGQLGDDDEYVPESRQILENAIKKQPNIDIWIPGLVYNNGHQRCLTPGLYHGNVSHAIYKPEIFAFAPMFHNTDISSFIAAHDYYHLLLCEEKGYRIGWLNEVCIKVRPNLPGSHGSGDDG